MTDRRHRAGRSAGRRPVGGSRHGRRRRSWSALLSLVVALAAVAVGGLVSTDDAGTLAAYTASVRNGSNSARSTTYTPTDLPYRDSFAGGQGDWTTYGGTWSTATTFGYGKMLETGGGTDGAKAVTGSPSWTDYTLQGDVQVNTGNQAGLLFRVTSPSVGADAFTGYYAAIDRTDGAVFLGRMDDGTYTSLGRKTIASGVGRGAFYHLVVQAVGCTFTVWQTTTGANTWTSLTYTDPAATCLTAGAIGLRDQDSTAGFRFVSATTGGSTGTDVAPWNTTIATGALYDGSSSTTYGGTWTFDGQPESVTVDPQEGVGDKNVLNRSWTDMTMTGDVRLTGRPTSAVDAGFAVRVSNPARGTDALQGFYAGISGTQVKLGRQANGWFDVVATDLPRGPAQNEWWHLTVAVTGCSVVVTVAPSAGGTPTQVATTFANCTAATGSVALRAKDVTASWRNTAVTPR